MISADSHIYEPLDEIYKFMPDDCISNAPKLIDTEFGQAWYIDSFNPQYLRYYFGDRKRSNKIYWSDIPKSSYLNKERIEIQKQVNIQAEVIYPSLGLQVLKHKNLDYKHNYFSAYNEWLTEFCSRDSKRLVGVGVVSSNVPAQMVSQINKIYSLGLRGFLLPCDFYNPEYKIEEYEIVWETLNHYNFPIAFHTFTTLLPTKLGLEPQIHNYLNQNSPFQDIISSFVFNNILGKYPNLKIVLVEGNTGWLEFFMWKMDYLFTHRKEFNMKKLQILPSVLCKNQVYVTTQYEKVTNYLATEFSPNLLWANDYPHPETIYPNTLVDELMSGLSKEVIENITHNNCAKLFNLN